MARKSALDIQCDPKALVDRGDVPGLIGAAGRTTTCGFGAKIMYDRAGYKEVARRRPACLIVRKALRAGAA